MGDSSADSHRRVSIIIMKSGATTRKIVRYSYTIAFFELQSQNIFFSPTSEIWRRIKARPDWGRPFGRSSVDRVPGKRVDPMAGADYGFSIERVPMLWAWRSAASLKLR